MYVCTYERVCHDHLSGAFQGSTESGLSGIEGYERVCHDPPVRGVPGVYRERVERRASEQRLAVRLHNT